ncbi:hypothetical protein VFPPC_09448 [Pochonia chlamydosporia 170]|uniref:Uncharacterized protein n=1 Tax=Pochonia chlamydosporia 170 TaxID=1380566 RepID=A0A179F823_METCM|nr:hypothetical protein VFPPC_09448 [Pochonia chlamydosporia 170]OAQ61635.1 hypothetical protein VFPPC_09448 [Pochonia chlamydosporia 170]
MSLAESPTLKRGERFPRGSDVADDSSFDDSTPRAVEEADSDPNMDNVKAAKAKKRSLFGFGKKKEDSSLTSGSDAIATPPVASQASKASTNASRITASPTRVHTGEHSVFIHPSSPTRAISSSPRVSSPAGSQIFERDVQDSTVLKPNSPAIPTHIQTENYIPPVLDDASEAITNEKLDPDTVEIVTHSSHQPASVTVTGATGGATSPYDQMASEWAAELASFADRVGLPPDSASNYGSLESADVRRLSFISFADVVQAEHGNQAGAAGSRDSIHMAGLTSLPSAAMNRSPSPIRSPVSSQGQGTSPPTSNPGSMKGVEMSPTRKPFGSPKPGLQNLAAPGGDLNIETMRQALRRTGSTDLSSFRSNPTSPVDGPGSR